MTAQTAEEWRAAQDARIAAIAAKQRAQALRLASEGRCEVCGSPDAAPVADFSEGSDGVRRLCPQHRKEAGLDLPPVALPYPD